jgi:hypothetical protein
MSCGKELKVVYFIEATLCGYFKSRIVTRSNGKKEHYILDQSEISKYYYQSSYTSFKKRFIIPSQILSTIFFPMIRIQRLAVTGQAHRLFNNSTKTSAVEAKSPFTPKTAEARSPFTPKITPKDIQTYKNPFEETTMFEPEKLSTEPFDKETIQKLTRPVDANDIEVKPDGILYVPEIKYRRALNQAFGPGG